MAERKSNPKAGLRFRHGFWHIQKQYKGRKLSGNTGCRKRELERAEQILQERMAEIDRQIEETDKTGYSSRSSQGEITYGKVALEYLKTALHTRVSDDWSMHNMLVKGIKGFADVSLQKLNRNHVKEFLQDLKARGRSNSTINEYISFINRIKNLASSSYQSEEGIPYIEFANPLPTFCKKNAHLYGIPFKRDERQPIILSDGHIDSMFGSFENKEYSDLIMFLLMTGARAGEVLGLRWDEEAQTDLNGVELQPKLKGRVFEIGDRIGDNKGNGRRYLFLNDTAKEILDRQREKDSKFVFVFSPSQSHPKRHLSKHSTSRREQYGTKIQARNARLTKYRDWKVAKKELGLPIIIRDIRSTFATRLRYYDIHLYDEKDCLGHIVKDVTRRYAQAHWLKLINILNEIFPNDPRRPNLKVVNG